MNTTDRNGSQGGALITPATGAVTGVKFSFVDVLEDGTTFSVLQNELYAVGAGKGQALTTRTWQRGDRIAGLTRAVTVTAGAVLCHNQV